MDTCAAARSACLETSFEVDYQYYKLNCIADWVWCNGIDLLSIVRVAHCSASKLNYVVKSSKPDGNESQLYTKRLVFPAVRLTDDVYGRLGDKWKS